MSSNKTNQEIKKAGSLTLLALLVLGFAIAITIIPFISDSAYAVPSGDHNNDGHGDNGDNGSNGGGKDKDGDGVKNKDDNCDNVANPDQTDTDGDGIGDACDDTPTGDSDGDGVDNAEDNCIAVSNADQADSDDDGIGNACDQYPNGEDVTDTDGDNINDAFDLCPSQPETFNGFQDTDGCPDSVPIVDTDSDGIADDVDNCAQVANADQADNDHDGIGNVCDSTPDGENNGGGGGGGGEENPTDTDGDGINDDVDQCDTESETVNGFQDTDGCPDVVPPTDPVDTDGDGVADSEDNCPTISNASQLDADNDGIGNACDDTPFGDDDEETDHGRRGGHGHNEEFARLKEAWTLCDTSDDAGDCKIFLDRLDAYLANHTSYSPITADVLHALTATGQFTPEDAQDFWDVPDFVKTWHDWIEWVLSQQ